MCGVPKIVITHIMHFYADTSAIIAKSHGSTESFHKTSGVLQDDTLLSYTFIALLNLCLCETPNDVIVFLATQ